MYLSFKNGCNLRLKRECRALETALLAIAVTPSTFGELFITELKMFTKTKKVVISKPILPK